MNPAAIEDLSARERAVARLVSRGLTTAQIAERLGATALAVRLAKTKALKKLGIDNPAQLAELAPLLEAK